MILKYKDWSKLYEQKDGKRKIKLKVHKARESFNPLDNEQQQRLDQAQKAKRKFTAKWGAKILPTMLQAIYAATDTFPEDVRFELENRSSLSTAEFTNDDPTHHVLNRVLFVRGELHYLEDNFFADNIDDLGMGYDPAYLNISTNRCKNWLPDPAYWLMYLTSEGQYDLTYSKELSNVFIGEHVFTCNAPYDVPSVDIIAGALVDRYLDRLAKKKISQFQIAQYSSSNSNIDHEGSDPLTYKQIFISDSSKELRDQRCERLFCRGLDKELVNILDGYMEDGQYFKEALVESNIEMMPFDQSYGKFA